MVSVGTMDTILVHAREVFRLAIIASASAIVLMHNHPSGDPTPSKADIQRTREIVAAAKALSILVHDHLVVGRGGHAMRVMQTLEGLRRLGNEVVFLGKPHHIHSRFWPSIPSPRRLKDEAARPFSFAWQGSFSAREQILVDKAKKDRTIRAGDSTHELNVYATSAAGGRVELVVERVRFWK